MAEFDFDQLDREVDDLLADVKNLLDEPEQTSPDAPAAPDEDEMPEQEPEDDAVFEDKTIIFQPLTAYEQSKAEYQTARRAEYERQREQERQLRQAQRQQREAEEDRVLRQMEQGRKKRRPREVPADPEAYSEWLYQQGEDAQTRERRETMAERTAPAQERPKRTRKAPKGRRGARWRVLFVVVLLLALGAGGFHFVWARQPKAAAGPGARKKNCATILLAGTDEGSYRTDTMLLLSVNRESGAMSLVSIPRDTLVYCEYSVPKLNSAYGWAGGGEAGMEELLTRIEEIIGFRPDGYVVTGLECFEQLVDLMGGVTFDVPVDMHYSDPSQNLFIDLSAGEQKLSGAQAMQLVRFRSGYADADLGRVKVQRDFLSAALHQWASVKNVYKLPAAIRLLTEHTKTSLSARELAWLAESAFLCGTEKLTMATMPGAPAWIGGGSYYVLDAAEVAALVNDQLNPYQKEVTVTDLSIRAG